MGMLAPARRTLLGLLVLAPAAFVAPPPARAETDTAQAAAFIKQTGQEMATLIGGAPTAAEKRRRMQPFLDRVVDVDGVARFCLGRHWRQATGAQQEAYLKLFHRVLLNNVVSRMGDYQHTEIHVIIGFWRKFCNRRCPQCASVRPWRNASVGRSKVVRMRAREQPSADPKSSHGRNRRCLQSSEP